MCEYNCEDQKPILGIRGEGLKGRDTCRTDLRTSNVIFFTNETIIPKSSTNANEIKDVLGSAQRGVTVRRTLASCKFGSLILT